MLETWQCFFSSVRISKFGVYVFGTRAMVSLCLVFCQVGLLLNSCFLHRREICSCKFCFDVNFKSRASCYGSMGNNSSPFFTFIAIVCDLQPVFLSSCFFWNMRFLGEGALGMRRLLRPIIGNPRAFLIFFPLTFQVESFFFKAFSANFFYLLGTSRLDK